MLLDLCFLYHGLTRKEYPWRLKNKTELHKQTKNPLKGLRNLILNVEQKNVLMTINVQ